MTESAAMQVDPSNVEQLHAWDGDGGDYWAAQADRFDDGVAGYHGQFLDAAAIESAENVLDIGCGNGRTTRDAARRAAEGTALGVDLSSSMIELARRKAELDGVANAAFRQVDAQVYPFSDKQFDVAISRHGAMFFGDPQAAFANIARALRRRGRLVLLTWQPFENNEHTRVFREILTAGRDLPVPSPDQPGPFSLSVPERVRALLSSSGFEDVRLAEMSEPMYFGRDVDDACQFISGQFAGMLADLDVSTRDRVLDDLRANMAEHRTDRGVYYNSAAWLIQARRS